MSEPILLHADCLDILRTLDTDSVDAVVTDPPYGLSNLVAGQLITALTAWANGDRERVPDGRGFMGKEWDKFVPPPAVFDECLRVLKPGGHLVAFAGSRTVDLMGLSIRMAGFEIRDGLTWLYGSGFPKSLDVSKAIDKAAGAQREVIGTKTAGVSSLQRVSRVEHGYRAALTDVTPDTLDITAPATPAAEQWQGWGTALKPAQEPIVLARKPLAGTVAANVLAHGTGALNIDGTRVGRQHGDRTEYGRDRRLSHANTTVSLGKFAEVTPYEPDAAGRWPSNVLLSHGPDCRPPRPSDEDVAHDRALAELQGVDFVPWEDGPAGCQPGCPVAELDAQSGTLAAGNRPSVRNTALGIMNDDGWQPHRQDLVGQRMDSGGASRFFPVFRYQAKAPTKERPKVDGIAHPTVKPLELMRWLVRLVTPPGGLVLDPFAGSGTTLQAAVEEGFDAFGIEREWDYYRLACDRLGLPDPQQPEGAEAS